MAREVTEQRARERESACERESERERRRAGQRERESEVREVREGERGRERGSLVTHNMNQTRRKIRENTNSCIIDTLCFWVYSW